MGGRVLIQKLHLFAHQALGCGYGGCGNDGGERLDALQDGVGFFYFLGLLLFFFLGKLVEDVGLVDAAVIERLGFNVVLFEWLFYF